MKTLILLLTLLSSLSLFAQVPPEVKSLWEKRDDRASLEAALVKLENSPLNKETLVMLTRGYFLLGDAHLTDKEQKMKAFEKARHYGEKGMEGKSIDAITVEDVDILYWSAASLGKWSKANGIMSSLKYKNQILSMIRKVESLKPDFFHGAVPRYWGSFYALAPSIAGGDMVKSKDNFKKSIAMAPESLTTRVLFAELYWAEEGNKKEYKKELEAVINAPEGIAELRPENNLEKKKAKRMLDNIADYF